MGRSVVDPGLVSAEVGVEIRGRVSTRSRLVPIRGRTGVGPAFMGFLVKRLGFWRNSLAPPPPPRTEPPRHLPAYVGFRVGGGFWRVSFPPQDRCTNMSPGLGRMSVKIGRRRLACPCPDRCRRARPDFAVDAPISACPLEFRRVWPDFGVPGPIWACHACWSIRGRLGVDLGSIWANPGVLRG